MNRALSIVVLAGSMVSVAACTDGAERSSPTTTTAPAGQVEFRHATFVVPPEWPVTKDASAFACHTNQEPGVFLGEGYGFCPGGSAPPPGPSVYVGPYSGAYTEDGDLEAPPAVPVGVEPPPGTSAERVNGRTVWVSAESRIFPDLNLVFFFVGVDSAVRDAIVASVDQAS